MIKNKLVIFKLHASYNFNYKIIINKILQLNILQFNYLNINYLILESLIIVKK